MTTTAAAPAAGPAAVRARVRPSLLDLALGVVVGVTLLWTMTLAEGVDTPAELPAAAFVAHVAVIVGTALWRVAPRAGLFVSMLGVGTYHALGGVPVGMAWPLLLPCYGVARRGYLGMGVAVATLHLAGMLGHRVVMEDAARTVVDLQVTLHAVAQEGLLLAAALLVGEVVRSRARIAADANERLALQQRRHEQETERRLAEERLRIAHDLHDVAAHTVSVISLHANVATERFDQDPGEARTALRTITTTSQRAARELRAVVGLLRDADAEPPPAGLAAIRASVERARGTGLQVTLHDDVADDTLDGAVGVAAARIVQESLTNVLRHAEATHVEVVLRADGGVLEIRVSDDGVGPRGSRPNATADGQAPPVPEAAARRSDGGGVGLLGMRERAAALGGDVCWGGGPNGGFVVTARLPAEVEA